MSHHCLATALLIAVILPCSLAGQASAAPRLDLVRIDSFVETTPIDAVRPIALSTDGDALLVPDPLYERQLSIVPVGRGPVIRFALSGAGPGEARNAFPVAFIGEQVLAFDPALARISWWRSDGTFIRSATMPTPALPVNTAIGLLGLRLSAPTKVAVARIVVSPSGEAELQALVDPNNPFLTSVLGVSTPTEPHYYPVLGSWGGGFIIADPNTYRLALLDGNGRQVRVLSRDLPRPVLSEERLNRQTSETLEMMSRTPQAARMSRSQVRQSLGNRRQPFFSTTSPIGLDSRNRIWVFGQEGDSGFADVFSEREFIARISLPCPGFESRATVNATWVAVLCGSSSAEVGATLHRFRIRN